MGVACLHYVFFLNRRHTCAVNGNKSSSPKCLASLSENVFNFKLCIITGETSHNVKTSNLPDKSQMTGTKLLVAY